MITSVRLTAACIGVALSHWAWAQGEATVVPGTRMPPPTAAAANMPSGAGVPAVTAPAVAAPAAPMPAADGTRLLRGNDRVIAPATPTPPLEGPATSFRFEEAPILDVVQVLLRDIMRVDFVVHPPVTGTVTLATKGDVTPDQAAFLLESALQANGL